MIKIIIIIICYLGQEPVGVVDDVVDDDAVTVPDGDGVASDKDPADLNVSMIIIMLS